MALDANTLAHLRVQAAHVNNADYTLGAFLATLLDALSADETDATALTDRVTAAETATTALAARVTTLEHP